MKSRVTWIALAVGALTIIFFWPVVHGGFLEWDDGLYLNALQPYARPSWRAIGWAFTSVSFFYYHPLTLLSHLVDFWLWGDQPWGHHATNLLLHGINAALAVWVAWLVFDRKQIILAGIVGLVFGIHPLQVESVAWVAERKNLLCAMFCLITIGRYLTDAGRRWAWIVPALAALLSKPMAVSLAPVLLVLDWYPLRRSNWPALVREKWPVWVATAAACATTIIGQYRMGVMAELDTQGVTGRLLVAARGVVFYLWKALRPGWLSPYYPLAHTFTLADKEFWVPTVLVLLVTGLCVWQARRWPALLAGWLIVILFVLPVSGLAQAGAQAVADRFAYLPLLVILLLAAAGLKRAWQALGWPGRAAIAALLLCDVSFLAVRSQSQIPWWHDNVSLWVPVIERYPMSPYANMKLARALGMDRRFEEALPFAVASVRLDSSQPIAHATLGLILLKLHEPARALPELQAALRLKPDLAATRYNLACAQARLGNLAEARAELQAASAADPEYAAMAARDPELAALRN